MKITLAAAILAMAAPLAMAEVTVSYSPDGTRTSVHPVKIGPIETDSDARDAFQIIARTAKRTCAHYGNSIRVFEKHAAARQCTAEAIENAVEAVGNDRLTAVYRDSL